MAQEPLKGLTDNLLSIFKEIATSEYEEQNKKIDLLEMKVNKIYTFIFEQQKLFESIFEIDKKQGGLSNNPNRKTFGRYI